MHIAKKRNEFREVRMKSLLILSIVMLSIILGPEWSCSKQGEKGEIGRETIKARSP